jgi:hypothetical protein
MASQFGSIASNQARGAERQVDSLRGPGTGLTRHALELARRDCDRASQDFPILPTSELDPLPKLPEEAEDGLTPPQRLAVAAMLGGQSQAAAARAAGVSRRTLFAWRQLPAFKHVYNRYSQDALDATAARIRNLMMKVTRVLSESISGASDFDQAIRVANSGRLWAALNAGAFALAQEASDEK